MRFRTGIVICVSISLLLLGGCDSLRPDSKLSPRQVTLEPSLLAVTAPDSIAPGDSLRVSVHLQGGGCRRFLRFDTDASDPRHLVLVPWITDWVGGLCTDDVRYFEVIHVFAPQPSGTIRLTVGSLAPIQFDIEVGDAPSSLERQRIEFTPVPTSSTQAPYAELYRSSLVDTAPERLWFDSTGVAKLARACSGDSGSPLLLISAPPYSFPLEFAPRCICGCPRVTKLGRRGS